MFFVELGRAFASLNEVWQRCLREVIRQARSRRLLAQRIDGCPTFIVMFDDVDDEIARRGLRKVCIAKRTRQLTAGARVVRLFDSEVGFAFKSGLDDHRFSERKKSKPTPTLPPPNATVFLSHLGEVPAGRRGLRLLNSHKILDLENMRLAFA